ncbi:MAG: GldG family protein [Acidobacteria bacterium]|nr:GldG family protein [Acidobacteriota bacterium]
MANRQTKFTAYASVYVLVIVAILAGGNYLANRYNKSYDTTSNKRYSLSDQTEKVVKNLKQEVKITYFDKADRFPAAKDLLDRYSTMSTKLKVEYIDPYKKPTIAKAAGIKTEGTTLVELGTKREEAKSVTEEEITGAIIRTLKGGDRTVCFVAGSGEHSLEDTRGPGYSQLKEAIEKANYKTRQISLLGADRAADAKAPEKVNISGDAAAGPASGAKMEIPKDCTVTVVAGPKFDYVQPAVDALKANVEGGGHVLFMLDPPLKLGRDETAENAALTAMLAGWGVSLDKNLVIDLSGIGQIFGLSEVVPLVTSYEQHPIVREMKEVAVGMPLTRSVTTQSADKTQVEKLFSSSKSSFATTNLSAAEIRPSDKDQKGPLPLAAAGTYAGASGQGRFVVAGSSGFAANNILRFNGNKDLFLNMISWLSADEDMISIRPKDPEDRRLSLTRAQMTMVRSVSQFLIPLMVILAGVAVWWKRR